jgi:anti-sigma factor RsiW
VGAGVTVWRVTALLDVEGEAPQRIARDVDLGDPRDLAALAASLEGVFGDLDAAMGDIDDDELRARLRELRVRILRIG